MIKSFKGKETEMLFNNMPVPRFKAFERPARRKLLYLHRAKTLQDLAVPPGNQLEALKRENDKEAVVPRRLLEPIHPGEILLEEFMKPLGVSINKLA